MVMCWEILSDVLRRFVKCNRQKRNAWPNGMIIPCTKLRIACVISWLPFSLRTHVKTPNRKPTRQQSKGLSLFLPTRFTLLKKPNVHSLTASPLRFCLEGRPREQEFPTRTKKLKQNDLNRLHWALCWCSGKTMQAQRARQEIRHRVPYDNGCFRSAHMGNEILVWFDLRAYPAAAAT